MKKSYNVKPEQKHYVMTSSNTKLEIVTIKPHTPRDLSDLDPLHHPRPAPTSSTSLDTTREQKESVPNLRIPSTLATTLASGLDKPKTSQSSHWATSCSPAAAIAAARSRLLLTPPL